MVHGTASDTIRNSYYLTIKCGEDPSKFAVKF